MKEFAALVVIVVALIWALTVGQERREACERRACSTSNHKAILTRGECICMEVPE